MHFRLRAISIAFTIAAYCAVPVHAVESDTAAPLRWGTPMLTGTQTMSHLLTAVSGKPNSERTDSLLIGVKAIVREENNFRLVRSDGAELVVPRDTPMGERMFSCMEKLEKKARDKVGNELGDYVHNLDTLTVDSNNSVELHHSGKEDVYVPLPGNQPWLPVHLKELRLKNIRLQLVEGKHKELHRIKQIDGIACVVHSAGVDLSIEPREFWRWKDKSGHTHICFGIQSLIPKPVRQLFHFPDVVHFQFTFKKKKQRAEVAATTTNNSEQEAPKSALAGQPDN